MSLARLALVLWLACGCLPASAQSDLPARFSVTGVSANDTLNVRAGPGLNQEIIGELTPDVRDIEVLELSANGSWGKIGWGEVNGWVGMRFMADQRDSDAEDGKLPRPLRCFGTEPYWSLHLLSEQTVFSTPEIPAEALIALGEHVAPGAFLANLQSDDLRSKVAMIERSACTDNMSDRDYGWAVRLFQHGPTGTAYRTGCCTLDNRQ